MISNFYTQVTMNSPNFHSTNLINDPNLLEPVFRAKVEAVLKELAAKGQPYMIFETYRSAERQEMLFKQGATKLRTVGVHHYSLAADLVKNIGGHPSWKGDFTILAQAAKNNDLVSGMDWGTPKQRHMFIDADHVQRISVADQTKLFKGTWYPDAAYDPYSHL